MLVLLSVSMVMLEGAGIDASPEERYATAYSGSKTSLFTVKTYQ